MVWAEPEIQNIAIETLKADSLLVPAPFVGVLNRWPRSAADTAEGATDWVWGLLTDPDYGRMRNVIWVSDGGDYESPGGRALGGRRSTPTIHGITHAGTDGRTALALLEKRAKVLFGRRSYRLNDGGAAMFRYGNRRPNVDADQYGYPGMIVGFIDLEATTVSSLLRV